jgi:hypothetical protein
MLSRYTFLVSPSAAISIFFFIPLSLFVSFLLLVSCFQLVHVRLAGRVAFLYVSGLLLIAENRDDPFGSRHFHA